MTAASMTTALDPHYADVIVAGAGIAGLSLAAALGRAGFSVLVLEAADAPRRLTASTGSLDGWDPRVSALTPASQAFLAELGVWPGITRVRTGPYTDMRVWDADGTGRIHFSALESGSSLLGSIVENRVTVAALLDHLGGHPSVSVLWADGIANLDTSLPEQVQVTTQLGRHYTTPLLVGADGARSFIRTQLGFATREWSYQQKAIVGTVALASSHKQTCYQAFLSTGPLALLPLAKPDLCSVVWSLDETVADKFIGYSDTDFVAAMNSALGANAPEVVNCSPRAAFPLYQCHAVDYTCARVVLVADAAHAIHPLAGQGINLGLADVRVLTEELIRANEADVDWGDIAVLRRYQRRRKGENLAMMAAMEAFKRGFGSSDPVVRVLRNWGLAWVDGAAPIKRWLASQAIA